MLTVGNREELGAGVGETAKEDRKPWWFDGRESQGQIYSTSSTITVLVLGNAERNIVRFQPSCNGDSPLSDYVRRRRSRYVLDIIIVGNITYNVYVYSDTSASDRERTCRIAHTWLWGIS